MTTGAFPNYDVTTDSALQAVNFLKHEKSPKHKEAVLCYLNNSPDDTIGAPSVQEFQNLADEIRHGHGTMGTLKRAKMTYCLGEAMKSVDQRHVENSDKIGMYRDESKGRLSIRFRTVARSLAQHSGTLGTCKDWGSGAAAMCEATEPCMLRFSTRFHAAPGNPRVKPIVKKHLFNKLRKNVICITVDSAGNEVLSSENDAFFCLEQCPT